MKAHQLIAACVEAAGGSNRVAHAMRAKTFQGTLHRICQGLSVPTRSSAERIARHFNIPVDAVYDDALATAIYRDRFTPGNSTDAPQQAAPVTRLEPAPPERWPHDRFPLAYWQALTAAERVIVEEAMLDAYDRLMARREQLRAATEKQRKTAA